MSKPIRHENYIGVDTRSSPSEVTMENIKKWKIRLEIMFPTGGYTATASEYLHEGQFPTLRQAPTAGFEWGRRILDPWRLTGLMPRQKVSRRLAEAVTFGDRSK